MNILLTNDDGVHADGLKSLYDVLSKQHSVYVMAPDRERSACSNAITTRFALTIKKIEENIYSITGFPADCVNVGLNSGFLPEIDLVVSGINHGPNVGHDLVFSGTAAGARTAYIFGKPGIAVSVNKFHESSEYFHDVSSFILSFIEKLVKDADIGNYFFNINYPDLPKNEIKGIKYATVGEKIYNDMFNIEKKTDSEFSLTLDGTFESVYHEGSDVIELNNGYITITPLVTDCTDYSYLEKLQDKVRDV